MSEIIYQKETKNWTKGNYALKTTRHALCRYIKERFNEFIDSLSYNDSELIQFLDCLGRNYIKNFAQLKESSQAEQLEKTSKKEIRCGHNACIQLMEIFISIHQQKSSLRSCYVWKTSPCHPFQNRSLRQERKETIRQITLLYMYVDKGDVSDCQSFEELDISKVIKVMRNCTELCPEGGLEHLDNTLKWRNTLMHSAKLQVDDNSITQMLEQLQKLLTFLQSSSEQCIDSAKDIQRLLENDVYIGNVPPELKQIWKGVKIAKEVAEKLSSSLGTHSGLHTDIVQLLEVLEDVSKREETPLCFEPTDYKKTIEIFIENQTKAIDKDLVLLDKDSEDYKKLIKTQKTIEAIHENLKSETDEETAVEFQKFSQKQSMQIERIGTGNFGTEMKDNDENFERTEEQDEKDRRLNRMGFREEEERTEEQDEKDRRLNRMGFREEEVQKYLMEKERRRPNRSMHTGSGFHLGEDTESVYNGRIRDHKMFEDDQRFLPLQNYDQEEENDKEEEKTLRNASFFSGLLKMPHVERKEAEANRTEQKEKNSTYVTYEGEGRWYPGLGIFFCSDDGIFSLSHRSEFVIDAQKFWCVSQYILYKNAELSGERETIKQILNCNAMMTLHETERRFKSDIHWSISAFKGCLAKFEQNEEFNRKLLRTEGMEIAFASEDERWGIGLPIGHPDSLNKLKWKGRNVLGNILTRIRNGEKEYMACIIS